MKAHAASPSLAAPDRRADLLRLILSALLPLAGCAAEPPEEAVGTVELALSGAPLDVRCVQLTAVQGATTVVRNVAVGPGRAAAFTFAGLPVGLVTLTEQAFTQTCSALGTAKWISDPQTVTLQAGVPVAVTFSLHGATAAGIVDVRTDFPDPLGGFTRLTAVGQTDSAALTPDPRGDAFWYLGSSGSGNTLNRLTTAGVATLLTALPRGAAGLALGSDGRLWVGAPGGTLLRIDPSLPGIQQTIALPDATEGIKAVAAGPDGNVWYVEGVLGRIGKVTPQGAVTEFAIPTAGATPFSLTVGPDGNLWFVEYGANKLARTTVAGVITEFTIPTAASAPSAIMAGPDGNLWFCESAGNKIGRITPAGAITEFALAVPSASPSGIGRGPDGNLWFGWTNGLGRITPAGVITMYPGLGGSVGSPTTGGDGRLYFTYFEDPYGGIARVNASQL